MRVNEIFCSVQGEGHYTGRPAVFLRLSGCNMRCDFCDTEHLPYTEMGEQQIINAVSQYKPRHIVITGGEPLLQLTSTLVDMLHEAGFYVQIETNGTLPLPDHCNVDWVTCSPKANDIRLQHVDELKVVYWGQDISHWESEKATDHRLQPLDTQDAERNEQILRMTFDYLMEHPIWSLSLQTHKMINVK